MPLHGLPRNEQITVRPMASGSLASWIPPLPLPVTVLFRTNEYELPSTLIPLPGLLGSARPLFSTVLPWIKAWSPATSMPSPVAPTTVKPLIVTQGPTTVKPLLAFRMGVNGEASDALGATVAPEPSMVSGLLTVTSSTYVPGHTTTVAPAGAAATAALMVEYWALRHDTLTPPARAVVGAEGLFETTRVLFTCDAGDGAAPAETVPSATTPVTRPRAAVHWASRKLRFTVPPNCRDENTKPCPRR